MTPTPRLTLGLLLTAAAGFVDAVGFVELGGYYTSFMGGNTTQLGTSLAEGAIGALLLPFSLIAMFFFGSFAGTLIALRVKRHAIPQVLVLVIASIGLSILLGTQSAFSSGQSMVVLAFGMGAQNALLGSPSTVRLAATFITGTLFTAGQDLARAIHGSAPPWRWAQNLLVWLALMLGAAAGALGYAHWGLIALIVPALVYSGFLGAALYRPVAQ